MNPENASPMKDTGSVLNTNNVQLQPIQYDYLKRFIKKLEEETMVAQREAKHSKQQNIQHDNKV